MSETTNTQPQQEWRKGRPSFKAFYPEVVLYTVLTILCIAAATTFSCKAIKKAKDSGDANAAKVTLTLSILPEACAQDEPIEAVVEQEEAPAPETVVEEAIEPPADEPAAEPAAEEPAEETAEEVAPKSLENDEAAEEAVSDAVLSEIEETDAEPVKDEAPADAPAVAKKVATPWGKILWIWIGCLIVPVVLWVWRGCKWIVAVYGTEYELRVDPENLRATTFLIRRGILSKQTDSMHIGAIKDVRSRQSFWQKYLKGGVGDVILFTSDKTDKECVLANMAEPSRVFNAFDELRRHYWARGGMQFSGGGDVVDGDGTIADDGGIDHGLDGVDA